MKSLPLVFLLVLAAPARAGVVPQKLGDGCLPSCETRCLKPFAIPDRWDDSTNVVGHLDWNRNSRYDSEKLLDDANGNGLWDVGESYDDANGNGQYDRESYNPLLTGYIPEPYPGNKLTPNGDEGAQLVLKEGDSNRAESGHYFAIDLPTANGGSPQTGASAYREALEHCQGFTSFPGDWLQLETGRMSGPTVAGVLALIAKDPAARYDPATKTIVGSIAPEGMSPRIIIVPITDPRIGSKAGKSQVQATKIAGFFLEEVDDSGTVRGRFLKLASAGPPCACCGKLEANWIRNCP